VDVVNEHEKKLLLISISCWFENMTRLLKWMEISGASRDVMQNAPNLLKKFARQFDHPDISLPIKLQVNKQLDKLSKSSARLSKRGRSDMSMLPLTVQVPCERDLAAMKKMVAGGRDDQQQRIQKIKDAVYKYFPEERIVETRALNSDYWVDRLPWDIVCECIRRNDPVLLDMAFANISADDPLLEALLVAHSREHLFFVMHQCAKLGPDEHRELVPGEPDVMIGQHSFELFIYDMISSIEQRRSLNLSFGLPTHHAAHDKANGFCVFNKTAALMAFEQARVRGKRNLHLHHMIVGLDVNRDNGLNRINMEDKSEMFVTHLDVYDPGVYPWDTVEDINAQLGQEGVKENKMTVWQKEFHTYKSIDLADPDLQRKGNERHPIIDLVLSELETALIIAAAHKESVIIYLPTGWDSHVGETAAAGKMVHGRWLTPKQSHARRFNDADWTYFNEAFMDMVQRYSSNIVRVYWQLEGGYADQVNQNQVAILANTWLDSKKELSPPGPSSSHAESSEPGRVLRQRR